MTLFFLTLWRWFCWLSLAKPMKKILKSSQDAQNTNVNSFSKKKSLEWLKTSTQKFSWTKSNEKFTRSIIQSWCYLNMNTLSKSSWSQGCARSCQEQKQNLETQQAFPQFVLGILVWNWHQTTKCRNQIFPKSKSSTQDFKASLVVEYQSKN